MLLFECNIQFLWVRFLQIIFIEQKNTFGCLSPDVFILVVYTQFTADSFHHFVVIHKLVAFR
jgi:hypothetical protein